VQRAILHRRDAIEAWSLGELFWTKFLAAPRAYNDIRLIADDFLRTSIRKAAGASTPGCRRFAVPASGGVTVQF
jgi:hypothetical protein